MTNCSMSAARISIRCSVRSKREPIGGYMASSAATRLPCETDLRTLSAGDSIEEAEAVFKSEHAGAVPVIDGDGRDPEGLLGADQLVALGGADRRSGDDRLALRRLSRCTDRRTASNSVRRDHREALVTDPQGRLLGMITQTDLLAAIWRGHIAEHIVLNGG